MSGVDWIASLGVTLLLAAFVLNGFGRLSHQARAYQVLNFAGAGLAAWAALQVRFWPFVVLEGVWAAVALAALAHRRDRP
ncbi:MAG: CBU_0592 family membrane protein [Thermoanaerobaculia bacterium]